MQIELLANRLVGKNRHY